MFRPLLISMFITSTAFATTWTVDDDGKADFDNIQAAVDAASDGDEIIVMPGTYTSTHKGYVIRMLGKGITLRGSNPADPEVVSNTIIDGENSRRCIVLQGNDYNPIVDGLTFAYGFGVPFDFNDDGEIQWWEKDGGGLYHEYSATFSNCIFRNNLADHGGAVRLYWTTATFTNCTFTDNSTVYSGGAIYNDNSVPTFTDCIFSNNTADSGGAIIDFGNAQLNNCIFRNNLATIEGGAISVIGDDADMPTITETIFCGNVPDHINSNYWIDGGGNEFNTNSCFDSFLYGGLVLNHCVTNGSCADLFGQNVTIKGDIITITTVDWLGCSEPRIDIYHRSDNGIWAQEHRIVDSLQDEFHPIATALDPPYLASASHEYGVSIYKRMTEADDPTICDGVRWDEVSTIYSPVDLSSFGRAVALDGEILAVSAEVDSISAVELYRHSQEGNWENLQRLILRDYLPTESDPNIARMLAIENNRLIVSWTGASSWSEFDGGVMVFNKNSEGFFEFQSLLEIPDWDPSEDSNPYVFADASGDRILLEIFDFANQDEKGGCWVFEWNEALQLWDPSEVSPDDDLPPWIVGTDSAIADDIVVRSHWYELNDLTYKTLAAYRKSESGWSLFSRTDTTGDENLFFLPGRQRDMDGFTLITAAASFLGNGSSANIITFDADFDGILDVDQVAQNPNIDLDNTGIPDAAEPDCNGNGIADALDIFYDPSLDELYQNGIIDTCEIDMDGDGIPDWWEAANDADYNNNWINDDDEGDCDQNGLGDVLDIYFGYLEDLNGDWIPDICQCLPDISKNNVVDVSDLLFIIDGWGEYCDKADVNSDGIVDVADLLMVIGNWGECE